MLQILFFFFFFFFYLIQVKGLAGGALQKPTLIFNRGSHSGKLYIF